MKHTVDELLQIVYHYYPRGMWDFEPGYNDTVEYRRSDTARKKAVSSKAWLVLLDRLRIRFHGEINNRSLGLASFKGDACFRVTHSLLPDPSRNSRINDEDHEIGLAISYIAPYYVVYSSRKIDRTYREFEPQKLQSFDLDDDETTDAQVMVGEMKLLFPDYEPMPPEIGNIVVPDVMAGNQELGKATLYHCFFMDSW